MKYWLSVLFIFSSVFLHAQDQQQYDQLVQEAWNLYNSGEYLKSAQKYSEAFDAFNGKGYINDRYNAACSWALAGEPDSAFIQLFKIAKGGYYTNFDHISIDKDLISLHEDPRWQEILTMVKANKEALEAGYNKELVAILDTVFREDQKYRMMIDSIADKYGRGSAEWEKLLLEMEKTDSVNLIKVEAILDEHGWLGFDSIGSRGSSTLFLVIQHAPLHVQEKYLPMLQDAVQKGNAHAANLALLEDRIALRKGERQTYGSQIGMIPETGEYYVLPLKDPENVDKRRASVGLGKLANYVSRWGIEWDVEAYIKRLPEYEALQRSKK